MSYVRISLWLLFSLQLWAADPSRFIAPFLTLGDQVIFDDMPGCSRVIYIEGWKLQSHGFRNKLRGEYLPDFKVGEVLHAHHVDRTLGQPNHEITRSRLLPETVSYQGQKKVSRLESFSSFDRESTLHFKLSGEEYLSWDKRASRWVAHHAVRLPEPQIGLGFIITHRNSSGANSSQTMNIWKYLGDFQPARGEEKMKHVYVLRTEHREEKILVLSYYAPHVGQFLKVVYDIEQLGWENWGTEAEPRLEKAAYTTSYHKDKNWGPAESE